MDMESGRGPLAEDLYGAIERDVVSLIDAVFKNKGAMENILKKMTKVGGSVDENDIFYSSTTRTWNNWPTTIQRKGKEQMSQYLNKVADIVRGFLGLSTHQDDLVFSSAKSVSGVIRTKMPDLIVISRSTGEIGNIAWSDIRAIGSLKVGDQQRANGCMDFMEFARICFSRRYDRCFLLGIEFRHTKFTLYVFNRSGILTSETLDVNEHPLLFLQGAVGILLLNHQELGYDTSFSNEIHTDKDEEERTQYVQVRRRKYRVVKELYVDRSLCGRGTVILQVRGMDGRNAGKVCVVKDAWEDRSRAMKEVEVLEHLNKLKVANVSKLIAHEVVRLIGVAGERVDDNTMIFRDVTMKMEIRDHHRLVLWPCGTPITHFSSLFELVSAALDLVETIEALDENDILHLKGSNVRKGYLIGFDYAIKNKEDKIIAKGKRTGTFKLPFIAIDVLEFEDIEHNVIYDLESVLYVLIWIAFLYSGPDGLQRELTTEFYNESILVAWSPATLDKRTGLRELARSKGYTMRLAGEFKRDISLKRDKFFSPLDKCLLALRSALFPPEPEPDSDPLLDLASEAEAKGMTYRVKERVFEGMKKTLRETKQVLESSVSCEDIPHASVNVDRAFDSLEDTKEEEHTTLSNDFMPGRNIKLGDDNNNKEQDVQGENSERSGKGEFEGAVEIEFEEKNGSDVGTTRCISDQTPFGSSESLLSRSNGKRLVSLTFAEVNPKEAALAARPHKRPRMSRSQTLNGSGTDNSE